MIDLDAGETPGSDDDLHPNPAVLFGGTAAVGLVSALSLPWPAAIASSVLGALMLAGADVDARKFLLPDLVTFGAVACGIIAAPLLDDVEPWAAAGEAALRAICVAAVLALFRSGYAWLRQSEGLGLGDVKLAAGIGAWLPIDAIPLCFGLATSSALLTVMSARLRGRSVMRTARIPFGAFLCPALWIVFFADRVVR
jgi:leader peptidase (prepilin peptidase)/N-methyltransferase